ncbi:hypothetical protein P5G65_09480 [Paenibacillus chondroitinus]|uniref:Uncharacterized protein n=1 Tax=Paenibacillus chondroitinus TaxID=59842 RepID=A0ABU6D8P3_9BACL|nr:MULTISPECIES: hypothetical protein [Paenibacillus]MCY9659695.1 hypothetical protein [Paenibacillus anseongense]MEB4794126.1 hypothetical protein [Paenibacillus chondroitinus]
MSEHTSASRTTSSQTSAQAQPVRSETEVPSTLDTRQMTPASMMQMQRTLGNRAVQGMVQRMGNTHPVIQRAGGTSATPGPAISQEQQQRNADLVTARDAKVTTLVDSSYTEISEKLKRTIDTYLTSDSQADPIRKNVKEKVKAEIRASMGSTGTAEQREDAYKFAQAKADGIMITKLKEYAIEVADSEFAVSKKTAMKDEANKAYLFTPNLNNATYEKQKIKAAGDAKKKLDTYSKTLFTNSVTASKRAIALKFAPPTAAGGTSGFDSISVGRAGTDELTKRIGLESQLVDLDVVRQETVDGTTRDIKDMEEIYLTILFAPMKSAVLSKLGVGRRAFRRSAELNAYREDLKKAARTKVNAQINNEIDNPSSTSTPTNAAPTGTTPTSGTPTGATQSSTSTPTPGPMQKEYLKTATKAVAYKESKVLVDDVMRDEANLILERVIPKALTIEEMTKVAKSSAYEVARLPAAQADKIRAASVKAAEEHAAKLLKLNKDKAVLEARKLTKGTKAEGTTAATLPDAAKTTQIKEAVQNDDKTKKLAKTIVRSVEASDLSSGLTKVGHLIDISTPNPGDASSLELELKIPVASAAGGGNAYFLFGFAGEAEREADELSVNSQLTFGAGFTTFGFDANARFGLFLEGKGKDTATVMNLLSYGLYRQMPESAQAYFWGKGGKSGESSLIEAEKWAMMIEEMHMGDDEAEVNVGFLTKLAMEANVGVASFSAELAFKRLSKYNKEIIEAKGKDAAGNVMSAAERLTAEKSGNGIGKGEVNTTVEAGTEIEIEFGKHKVAFGLEGSATFLNGDETKLKELNLQLSASIPSQFGEEGGDFTKYASKIVTAAIGGGKNLTALFKKGMASKADKAKQVTGSLVDAGTDALYTGNYFDDIGASFASKIQGDETVNDTMRSWLPGQDSEASDIETVDKIGLSNALKLEIGFQREYDGRSVPTSPWVITISASQVKSLEVDAEIVKVAVEKSKRLGQLEFRNDKTMKYEFIGFEGGGQDRPAPTPSTSTATAGTTGATGATGTASTGSTTNTGSTSSTQSAPVQTPAPSTTTTASQVPVVTP